MSTSARYMRTAARNFATDKARETDRKVIRDAESALINARGAYYYETDRGTPERDAAYEVMAAAEAHLTELDPNNSLFS